MRDSGERADVFLVKNGFAASRAEAQAAIRAGFVEADGQPVTKSAQKLKPDAVIRYAPAHPYVSRGGVKLAAALDRFRLSPEGRVCLDIGASTGGFTEVLLERNAARVYAVDVGHGQLHGKIAADPRVISLEGVNARTLGPSHVPELLSAIVADVSFISLKLALPSALSFAAEGAWGVFLVKPQFELGPDAVPSNGVVRNNALRLAALAAIVDFVNASGYRLLGTMESPIAGASGNREFLLAATKQA